MAKAEGSRQQKLAPLGRNNHSHTRLETNASAESITEAAEKHKRKSRRTYMPHKTRQPELGREIRPQHMDHILCSRLSYSWSLGQFPPWSASTTASTSDRTSPTGDKNRKLAL